MKVKKAMLLGAYAMLLSCSGCKSNSPSTQKEIIYQKPVKESDFILLPCNSSDDINTLEKLIEINQENGIHCGLIFSSTAKNLGEAYLEVEYIKEILNKTNLEYPICLDIDVQSDEKIITAMSEKLEANGCYISLYSESKTELSQKFSQYDSVLKEESNQKSNIIIHEDGSMSSKIDLAEVIQNNNLNSKVRFVEDETYIVKKGDNLTKIANLCSLDVNDLKIFNQIPNENAIEVGQKIILPNIQNSKNIVKEEEKSILKGIDVSSHQGEVDWDKVASQIDFAILRVCDFYNKDEKGNIKLDTKFIDNMEECQARNIPVGVYAYSRATTIKEAEQEANFVLEAIKDYDLDYPIYVDVESNYHQNLLKTAEGQKKMKEIIHTWCSIIEESGYFVGVYSQKSMTEEFVKLGLNEKYNFWVARYGINQKTTIDNALPKENLTILALMTQTTDKGKVEGIQGYVDINVCDPKLPKAIRNLKEQNDQNKKR